MCTKSNWNRAFAFFPWEYSGVKVIQAKIHQNCTRNKEQNQHVIHYVDVKDLLFLNKIVIYWFFVVFEGFLLKTKDNPTIWNMSSGSGQTKRGRVQFYRTGIDPDSKEHLG